MPPERLARPEQCALTQQAKALCTPGGSLAPLKRFHLPAWQGAIEDGIDQRGEALR